MWCQSLSADHQPKHVRPAALLADRKLSDPIVNLTFEVDMSLVRNFGQFDPTLSHGVAMPGNFTAGIRLR